MNSAIVMFVMPLCERCVISKYPIYTFRHILVHVKFYFSVILFQGTPKCTCMSDCPGQVEI